MISVTYAGAGGGKTTSMVSSIIDNISSLDDCKFLCVITYTNDATRNIKKKLSEKISIPNNVFIGTIHSFLFRFIFKPHFPNGSKYSIVSSLPKKEDELEFFIKWAREKIEDQERRKRVIKNKWNERKKEIYERLDSYQLITNDLLVKRCKELTSKAKVRKALSTKLQFLFIDEYQDTYKWLHDIFLDIYKGGKTQIYAIGDPNQSIYGFSYGSSENSAQKPKNFQDYPLCQLKGKCDNYCEKNINFRSSEEIVTLANKYNKLFSQQSNMGSFSPIFFIEDSESNIIIEKFYKQRKALELNDSVYFLANSNDSLLPYKSHIEMNENDSGSICIRTFESAVSQYIGAGISEICFENDITRMQFRSFSISLSKLGFLDIEVIKTTFRSKFGKDLSYLKQSIEKPSIEFKESNIKTRALTIHKSKGLEAESVLILFKSNNHIIKSFRKKELICSPSDDDLRLAYVAFTRAKKLLVIACKEKMSKESIDILKQHEIQIIK